MGPHEENEMATDSNNTEKAAGAASDDASMAKSPAGGGGSAPQEIEQVVRLPVGHESFVEIRITIAAAPKVEPGFRPQRDEVLMIRSLDADHVLTISADLQQQFIAEIDVGGGGPPIAEDALR